MNMLFETNVIELKTKIVQIRTNTGAATYLMMESAPKAHALTKEYLACAENNVTTLPNAYVQMMGGVQETKGFTWATVKMYRMYWEKRDTIKEYWRTHATDPKDIEMCDVKDWTEGYRGKPTEKKTSATPTPTSSVEVDRLGDVIESLNGRLSNAAGYVDELGRYYEHLARKEHASIPPGPNGEALQTLVSQLFELKQRMSHDIPNVPHVPQLE